MCLFPKQQEKTKREQDVEDTFQTDKVEENKKVRES